MLIEADCPFQCIRVAKVRRAFPRKVLSSNIRYFAFWVKYRQCHQQSGTIVRRGGISSQIQCLLGKKCNISWYILHAVRN